VLPWDDIGGIIYAPPCVCKIKMCKLSPLLGYALLCALTLRYAVLLQRKGTKREGQMELHVYTVYQFSLIGHDNRDASMCIDVRDYTTYLAALAPPVRHPLLVGWCATLCTDVTLYCVTLHCVTHLRYSTRMAPTVKGRWRQRYVQIHEDDITEYPGNACMV
jgi:hypothetical protein